MTGSVRLSRRLTLEEIRRTYDGSGGYTAAWAPVGTLWAEVVAKVGREDYAGARQTARVPYRIVVRGAPFGAPSRPKPNQRFREGTRIFDILTVAERDPDGLHLVIEAEERTAS